MSVVREESAIQFMTREPKSFNEWLAIGSARSNARIRACIQKYPRPYVRHALIKTCMGEI